MSFIYKIENDINDKLYIGKTDRSLEKRFKEHCKESKRKRCEKRPLYNAMNKYGIEHFSISLIEETNEPEIREQYWIAFYDTYKNGYNATLGGEGIKHIDYNFIYNLYLSGKTQKEIYKEYGYDTSSIREILKSFGISDEERKQRGIKKYSKQVAMCSLSGDIIQIFASIEEALRFLNKPSGGGISAVCKGTRKTAYGYKWKYIEEEEINSDK